LSGNNTLMVQPLPPRCSIPNVDALITTGPAATVQLQILVEPDGRISWAQPVNSSGNSAVDNLVSCVVQERLQLIPASSAGAPIRTDAFILESQIRF
jgi:hypothetical protein